MISQMEISLDHASLHTRLTGTLDSTGNVARYRGIPYARLNKRWTRSVIREELTPDFDARDFGPKCPQPGEQHNNTTGYGPYLPFPNCGQDEYDCLNVNVICPKKVIEPLPVFVWIHGGGLLWGANSDPMWEGTSLVANSLEEEKPIITVTVNYRLGPFGFLAPRDPEDPDSERGNFGLHDQRCALEWVKRHIAGFGGDAERITIAGESAGGCAVHAQVALQERLDEPRLFQRAIIHSGTIAIMGYHDRQDLDDQWKEAIVQASCQGENQLQRMREISPSDLLSLGNFLTECPQVFLDDYVVSGPCLGPRGEFVRHQPVKLDGLMHGDVGDEGSFMMREAARPGKLDQLRQEAVAQLGETQAKRLLGLYGLEPSEGIPQSEISKLLYRLPEDVRFYLLSNELWECWPQAAFWHISAKSPFESSCHGKGSSYHTIDTLYLFGAFDEELNKQGLTDHVELGRRIKLAWLRFIHGEEPWEDGYQGTAATFDVGGVGYGSLSHCRGWTMEREKRIEALQNFDFEKILRVALRGFICL